MKTLLFTTALIILIILLISVLYDIINNIINEIKDHNLGSYNWEVRDINKRKKKKLTK